MRYMGLGKGHTRKHRVRRITNENKSVFPPCRERRAEIEIVELYVFCFPTHI